MAISCFSKEPARLIADQRRVAKEIIENSVARYVSFVDAAELSNEISREISVACASAANAFACMDELDTRAKELASFGQQWRKERQLGSSTVGQHAKLLELLEAPGTLELCLRNEMYHEAVLILDHVTILSSQPEKLPMLQSILEQLHEAVARHVEFIVFHVLSNPLSVSAAIKIVNFLSRVGYSFDQIQSLFLEQRSIMIEHIMQEIISQSSVPYTTLTKILAVVKVHISELVMQCRGCFPFVEDNVEGKLSEKLVCWASSMTFRAVNKFTQVLQQVTSCSEIASLMEQNSHSTAVLRKVGIDISPSLRHELLRRVESIFVAHMEGAWNSFVAAMATHVWRDTSTVRSVSHAGSVPAFENNGDASSDGSASPPVSLLQFLPLAFALNAILAGCNEIRKVAVLGVAYPCTEAVIDLLKKIVSRIASIERTYIFESGERKAFQCFVRAFSEEFTPHVARTLDLLFKLQPPFLHRCQDLLKTIRKGTVDDNM